MCFDIIYIWGILLFLFGKGSIPVIMYSFSFFIRNLFNSGLQIINLISDHPRFMDIVNIRNYLVVTYLESSISTSNCSFSCFVLVFKFYNSGLYIITLFSHGKCFIWRFLVFTFIKNASVTTIYFYLSIFPDLKMIKLWSVNHISQI